MNYDEFIQNILRQRGRNITDNIYKEKHHIIPKCMNGSDDINNIIELSAKEHFIAHKLLAKKYPHNNKIIYAWWIMAYKNKGKYKCTPEEYAEAKNAYSKAKSKAMSGKNNPMYGKKGKLSPRYGKKNSPETSYKKSRSQLGKRHKAISIYKNIINQPNRKPIAQINKDTNEVVNIFMSTHEAAKKLGYSVGNISLCCNGKIATYKGYIWKHLKDIEVL